MIHLYAEHLLNIRTLSIQASLPTVSNKETEATLSADGNVLTLTHEGESASIRLPINLSPNRQSTVTLTIPAVPSRELTFRLSLEEKEGVTNGVLSNGAPAESGNLVPWTANSLTTDTQIYCASCDSVLVERGKVQKWKDLPSEGWAEMMDFWHCHKPNEPHSHDHAESKKGYAANSELALRTSVGLVDAMNFILVAEDCTNVKVADASKSDDVTLVCSKCDCPIGQLDQSTQGFKLRKLRISLSSRPDQPATKLSAENWFACLLLDAMDSQGARNFIAHGLGSSTSKPMKLWIFSPELSVSSSVRSSTEYVRVAKVMWQDHNGKIDGSETLAASAASEGELKLLSGEMELLRSLLEKGGALLPEGGRKFLEWNVGLLERFNDGDIGMT